MALKTAHKITVKVDGAMYQFRPGGTYHLGGVERELVEDSHEPGEFTEHEKAGYVEGDLPLRADTDEVAIRNISAATVVVETDVGKSWVGRDWHCSYCSEINDGTLKVKFAGPPMEPLTGGANG